MLSGICVVAFRAWSPEDESLKLSSARDDFRFLASGNSIWDGSVWSLGVIAPSLFKVFYSFAGLENVTNVLNEVKNPVRTLRSVTITALLTAVVLYLLINVAFFLVVPLDEVKSSGELIAALFFEKVFGDTLGRRILPIMVALSGMGNVMVVTFALARLNQEIARTGLIPFSRILSSTAPFGSPLGGLLVHYVPSFLVIVIPSGDIYSFILEVEGYPSQFFSVAVCVGLLILRFQRPDLHRPYKAFTPGVIIHIALSLVLISAPFFPSEAQKSRGVFWSAAYAIVGLSM
jgi:amino acid transporter